MADGNGVPLHQPPQPIEADRDGAVRFAVRDQNGLRSAAWSAKGRETRQRDVYIGTRQTMSQLKLSLHALSWWQLAYTTEYAMAHGITDRVLMKFEPPDPVARGWRLGASIIVPTSSLRAAMPEKPSAKVQWYAPSPNSGWAICFHLYVSESAPNFEENISFDGIGEVGRILLPTGGGVMIVADEVDYSAQQQGLAEMRALSSANHAGVRSTATFAASVTWSAADDGHPLIWDLGDPLPLGSSSSNS